jgi:RNA-directed DNA polymerase
MANDWSKINWDKCDKYVCDVQHRIVSAIKAGNIGRAMSLQRLIVNSFSGRAIAVKCQSKRKGRNTPGVDNQTWTTNLDRYNAISLLGDRDYRPKPLKKVFIPKTDKSMRQLSIPTLIDRTMQTLYSMALDPISETVSDRHSYGFRKERSTIDAIFNCFNILHRKNAPTWVLKADIEKCFDNISHDWLMSHIPINKDILRGWLKVGFVGDRKSQEINYGIPQGGNISSILMNMALNGMEYLIYSHCRHCVTKDLKVSITRYADDFIVTASTKRTLLKKIIPIIEKFLMERNLKLSKEKTKIIHINDGFDFLGQNIRKYNGKLLLKPSKCSFNKILVTIQEFVINNIHTTQYNLINELNLKIIGWFQYHKYTHSRKPFRKIECKLKRLCWYWSKSRHPTKGKKWIRRRYFIRSRNGIWIFAAAVKHSKYKFIKLHIPIKFRYEKYTPINHNYNPYDPGWTSYIMKRKLLQKESKRRSKTPFSLQRTP